jgi:hypothetical protein
MTGRSCRQTGERLPMVMNTPHRNSHCLQRLHFLSLGYVRPFLMSRPCGKKYIQFSKKKKVE